MTIEYRYDDILEMLPAYALGSLDADEMLAVEGYLRTSGSVELEARLAELEDSIALLAYQAPEQPLPPTVKARVLSAIQAEIAPVPTTTTASFTAPSPSRQRSAPPPSTPGWITMLGNLLRPVAWAAVGAAIVFFLLQPAGQGSRAELAAAQATIQRLETDLQTTQTELASIQDEVTTLQRVNEGLESQLQSSNVQLAVLARPSQTIPLAGTEAAPDAAGTMFVSDRNSVLVLTGLEVLPEDSTYELWLIPADGNPLPAGLLVVNHSDANSLSVTLPDDAGKYAAVGITVEPAGGSDTPTGPLVLLSSSG